MADIKQQMEKLIQQGGTAEPPEDGRLFDDTTAGRVEQEREEETGERERAGETAANSSGTDEKEKEHAKPRSQFGADTRRTPKKRQQGRESQRRGPEG